MKQPLLVQQEREELLPDDTGTIISWVLLSLLNNIYLVTKIHVFMYLKDIYTRSVSYEKKRENYGSVRTIEP
jgi:hypothetical protein